MQNISFGYKGRTRIGPRRHQTPSNVRCLHIPHQLVRKGNTNSEIGSMSFRAYLYFLYSSRLYPTGLVRNLVLLKGTHAVGDSCVDAPRRFHIGVRFCTHILPEKGCYLKVHTLHISKETHSKGIVEVPVSHRRYCRQPCRNLLYPSHARGAPPPIESDLPPVPDHRLTE
jgi:hypothetical protein